MNSNDLTHVARRSFLRLSSAVVVGAIGGRSAQSQDPKGSRSGKPPKTYRVGVIGATGRGDYGHGLDVVWRNLPNVELVAVTDADPRGLESAGKRLKVSRLYADYRQMLASERLDVVSVAPRWLEDREAMVIACAEAGCNVLCDKPFAIDAASADRMLAACQTASVKSAVVHQQRAAPGIREIQVRLSDGRLGKILSMRSRGKEDARAGGEDMMVLGCHIFDLMNHLAGPPQWAAGEVLQDGRPVTREDSRQGAEPVGPVAGDCVSATFGFPAGVHGHYESKSAARESGVGERYALEIVCSKGIVLVCPNTAEQFILGDAAVSPRKQQTWESLGPAEWHLMKPADRFAWCKVQIASDLLSAIEEDREPLANGAAAAVAIEMVQAVYTAHLAGGRVAMPLNDRTHPLLAPTKI